MINIRMLYELWAWFYVLLHVHLVRPVRKKNIEYFYGKKLLTLDEANQQLSELLCTNSPFMVARIGAVEMEAIRNGHYIHCASTNRLQGYYSLLTQGGAFFWLERVKQQLRRQAGFFPTTDAMMERFYQHYLEDIPLIDLLGIWYRAFEPYICRHYCPLIPYTHISSLEPFFAAHPWTHALAGKKVLVIHPFTDTIERQYAKRTFLFSNPDILPEFHLETLKAVQSQGGDAQGYDSWFAALEAMCLEITNKDFDIAIIGAGAYGLPLAAYIKRLGKKAIHMGGVTQLLFGIKGKRWDKRPRYASLYNEYWVYPSADETHETHQQIDRGSYWQ